MATEVDLELESVHKEEEVYQVLIADRINLNVGGDIVLTATELMRRRMKVKHASYSRSDPYIYTAYQDLNKPD